MSKARSLLKKLRTKKLEEEGQKVEPKKEEKSNTTIPNIPSLQNQARNSRSVPKEVRRESFIDPLDYFKKEHIFVQESNMEEYGGRDLQKELEEQKKKEKEDEEEKTKKIGAMIGVRGFKMTFEEMMKARSKIKKEPEKQDKKSLSVGTRNTRTSVYQKPKYEYIKKGKDNKEENLMIKLILAKRKFNLGNVQHIYMEALRRIEELKGYNDFPDVLKNELDYIEEDLKLDKNLIICPDVQVVETDDDDTDTLGKKVNLDQVMNKLNIRPDM